MVAVVVSMEEAVSKYQPLNRLDTLLIGITSLIPLKIGRILSQRLWIKTYLIFNSTHWIVSERISLQKKSVSSDEEKRMFQRHNPKVLLSGFLLITVILLLSACATDKCAFTELEKPIVISGDLASLVDRSLVTQEPCPPPCWQGITSGTTSGIEALTILEELEFIDQNSIDVFGNTIRWKTVFPEAPTTTGIVLDSEDIVSKINVNKMWYDVNLNELIEIYGVPDGILARPQLGFTEISGDCAEIDVVWFESGLEVTVDRVPLPKASQLSSLVAPDLYIYRTTYFPPVSNLREFITVRGDDTDPDYFQEWEEVD